LKEWEALRGKGGVLTPPIKDANGSPPIALLHPRKPSPLPVFPVLGIIYQLTN
jgi:hypothetical protein